MLSRRDLISRLAAAGVVGLAAGAGRAVATTTRTVPGTPGLDGVTSPEQGGDAPQQAGASPEQGHAETAAPNSRPASDTVAVGEVEQAKPSEAPNGPPPWDLLRPLALGSLVARGWRVAELSPVEDGSCVLTLRNERGRSHRVHMCRNDGSPQGVVYSKRFDLLVMNGGQGDLPTDESLAQAVAEVAHALAANEGERRLAPVVTALLPHSERVRLFSAIDGSRLR